MPKQVNGPVARLQRALLDACANVLDARNSDERHGTEGLASVDAYWCGYRDAMERALKIVREGKKRHA